MSLDKYDVVIVGGGSAGISVAARLCNAENPPSVAIIEPSLVHYYQPIWTLVGGGVFSRGVSAKPEADYIPDEATWLQDKVTDFDPVAKTVTTEGGSVVGYEQLVVAPGIQLDWSKIDGLDDHLGTGGVCSNYSYESVESTWRFLKDFSGGNAIFTFPKGAIKCAGAPQKIMYLADEHMRRIGVRQKSRVIYAASTAGIFGIERYAKPLREIIERKGIETHFKHHLVALRPKSREAVFEDLDSGAERILDYQLIHVVPPQSAPDFIKRSPLANADGWVDVDMYTTQHNTYPDVWSIGDASSLPNAKTGAAVRKQAPVLVDNLLARRAGREPLARYDGYGSCPLVTGYGKLILAEFGYGGVPMESFPFDQNRERYSMYALKAYGLPAMYWDGMLRGRI